MQIKATVTACFGNQAQIYSNKIPNLPLCQLKKNLTLVAGEEIICELNNNQAVFVEKISVKENTKYFYRYSKQILKPIAANLDCLVIVCATLPVPLSILLDSFLILAENQDLSAILVFNKTDLQITPEVQDILEIYQNLGYKFFMTSTKTGQGITELKTYLHGKNAAFCGASGVGKSSLLNELLQGANAAVGDIGKNRGRHTTSAAHFYVGEDYNLIDLPGANKILPDTLPQDEILRGYIELRDFLNSCKFTDCQHSGDTGCEIQKAFEQGHIHPTRWQNLQKFLRS